METQREIKQLEYCLTFKVQGLGISIGLEEHVPLSFPPRGWRKGFLWPGEEQEAEGRSQADAGVGCDSGSPTAGQTTWRERNRCPDSRGTLELAFLGRAQESGDHPEISPQHRGWQWTWRPCVSGVRPEAACASCGSRVT